MRIDFLHELLLVKTENTYFTLKVMRLRVKFITGILHDFSHRMNDITGQQKIAHLRKLTNLTSIWVGESESVIVFYITS